MTFKHELIQRDQRVAEMTHAGFSAEHIATELGISTRSVTRAKKRRGLTRPTSPVLTQAELERAEAMLNDGANYVDVARTLGRSERCIRKHLPGRGWARWSGGPQMRRFIAELDRIPSKPGGTRA